MIASNSLAGTARSWATQARRAAAQIRKQHLQAEAAAADLAKNPDLRRDAVARRQAGLRATVGLSAAQHLTAATDILHRGSVELARRALPQVDADTGKALLARETVRQMIELPEHELAALMREDRNARQTLFANATSIELRRLRDNPLVNIEQLQATTLAEYAPDTAQAIDDAREAQRELLNVAGRLIASGVSGQPFDLDGLPPATVASNAVDHARRYKNLGPEWEAVEDGIFRADVAMMTQTAQGAADKGAA